MSAPETPAPGAALEFVPRTHLGPQPWNDFVYASPDGWLGAVYEWLDMTAGVEEWRIADLSFGVRQGGRLVALMPLGYSPTIRRLASPYWGQSGPVFAPGLHGRHERKLIAAILDEVRRIGGEAGADHFDIMVNPMTARCIGNRWGVNPFVHFGLADVSTHSRIIDLRQGEAAIWAALSGAARNHIRGAQAAGFRVEAVDWPRMLDEYYDVHMETYTRTGVPPHPRAYFEGIANVVHPRSHALLWAGYDAAGRPVAFHNTLRFGRCYQYWTSCSRNDHVGSGVNDLLMWTAIAAAAADGGEWFEVGEIFPAGSPKKDIGLTTFKSKFGGEDHRNFRARLALPAIDAPVAPSDPALAQDVEAAPPRPLCITESLALCRQAGSALGAAVLRRLRRTFSGGGGG